jgi:hypothetical protein
MVHLVVVLVACVAVAACGSGATSSSSAGSRSEHTSTSAPATPTDGGRTTDAGIDADPTASRGPFTLYVSNQSFEDPNVQITISIDGVVVVDEHFAVEEQHNWIAFEPDVPPGDHTLTARSNTGAETTVEFTTESSKPRWAVVEYWWYPEAGPRAFTFEISDEPMAFG